MGGRMPFAWGMTGLCPVIMGVFGCSVFNAETQRRRGNFGD
jgi:hypothetical protein